MFRIFVFCILHRPASRPRFYTRTACHLAAVLILFKELSHSGFQVVCLLGGPGLLNIDSSVSFGFHPLSAGKEKYQDSKQMDSGAEDCNVIAGNPTGAQARSLYAPGRNTTMGSSSTGPSGSVQDQADSTRVNS